MRRVCITIATTPAIPILSKDYISGLRNLRALRSEDVRDPGWFGKARLVSGINLRSAEMFSSTTASRIAVANDGHPKVSCFLFGTGFGDNTPDARSAT